MRYLVEADGFIVVQALDQKSLIYTAEASPIRFTTFL